MLHSYKFSNFYSFAGETEISFEVSRTLQANGLVSENHGKLLNKSMAIIGPNGSGKTNAIKAITFIVWFIQFSFQKQPPEEKIYYKSHFFNENKPSNFEAEFDVGGTLWRYELSITNTKVLREALYKKKSRTFSYVFIRELNKKTNQYSVKQQGFGFPKKEAEKTRKNCSLISAGAQYGVALASMLTSAFVNTNVTVIGRDHFANHKVFEAAKYFSEHIDIQTQAKKLLKNWDLGLKDIEFVKYNDPNDEQEKTIPFGVHSSNNSTSRLNFLQESSGTQSAFILLFLLLPVLKAGGIAIVDELESDLHPHMLKPILELFASQATNPGNAQILFTTHSIEILNLLHKSQILLVEKDENCSSQIWRLDSVKGVRIDDNLYAKYMAGAYSAVPEV